MTNPISRARCGEKESPVKRYSSVLIHRDLDYVDTAGRLARSLVEQTGKRG
ncbi:hypothetical protein QRQ56_01920 [Bradyrhizobium sp. U531]|uniref:hypothetical protein n=1 Tax=Bradyrhizobium sp. U531 TaxID=3053458 RepID=UPI003F436493